MQIGVANLPLVAISDPLLYLCFKESSNVSVSFGSWKVLEAKRGVICIGLWGLEDLCLDGLFCVRWVLLGGDIKYFLFSRILNPPFCINCVRHCLRPLKTIDF